MSSFLYRNIAQSIVDAIASGALRAGDRLPSVRAMCRERGLSLATAVATYRWLEVEGHIEARPRSGYFVRARTTPLSRQALVESLAPARLVGMSARAMKIIQAHRRDDLVPLGAASPDATLFPAEALRRQLNQAALRQPELITRYVMDPSGLPALKSAIARRLASAGTVISPDELIITVGCAEALNLALAAVARPGDTVLVEAPTYYGLLQIIETQGLKAIEVPSDPQTGISLEAVEVATRVPGQVKALLLVPNFANPTGALLPTARKQALAALLGHRQVALIEDDVYGDMSHDGERPPLIKRWDQSGQVISCGSFTKSLAPALRVGWVAPGRYRDRVEMLKFRNTIATPPLLQAAIAGYLDSGGYERHLARLRERFRRQTARMMQLVDDHFPSGTRLSAPRGGFVLWVELQAGMDTDLLAERALEKGIAVTPGSLFSLAGSFRHCLRLGCGQPITPRVEAAIRQLGRLVADQQSVLV